MTQVNARARYCFSMWCMGRVSTVDNASSLMVHVTTTARRGGEGGAGVLYMHWALRYRVHIFLLKGEFDAHKLPLGMRCLVRAEILKP